MGVGRRRLWRAVALVAVALAVAACRPSDVPEAFNGGEVLALPPVDQAPEISTYSVAISPDGSTWSLVRAGYGSIDSAGADHPSYLVRHLADGSLDTAFGDGGALPLAFQNAGRTYEKGRVVAAPDGSVAVLWPQPAEGYAYDLAVHRVTRDGTVSLMYVDTTFDAVILDIAGFEPVPGFRFTAAFDDAGRLVVMPYESVVRLLPDGTVDPSFNGGERLAVTRDSLLATVGNEIVVANRWPLDAAGVQPELTWISEDGGTATTVALPDYPGDLVADGTGRAVVAVGNRLHAYTAGGVEDPTYGTAGTDMFTGPAFRIYGTAPDYLLPLGGGRVGVFLNRSGTADDLAVAIDAAGAPLPTWAGDGTLGLSTAAGSSLPLSWWRPPASSPTSGGFVVPVTLDAGGARTVMYDGATGALVPGAGGDGLLVQAQLPRRVLEGRARAVIADDRGIVVLERGLGEPNAFGDTVVVVDARRVGWDGTLDGFALTPRPSAPDRAVTALVDGYGLLSGTTSSRLARFDDAGLRDDAFAQRASAALYEQVALATAPDGTIVGSSLRAAQAGRLARYAADGTVLATRALPVIPVANYADHLNRTRVAVDAQNRVVLAARQCDPAPAGCTTVVRRFLPDLSDDPSFGTAGAVVLPAAGSVAWERIDALAVDGDGRVTVSGWSGGVLRLARLAADGSFDTTFGTGGVVRSTVLGVQAATVDDAGRVVVVGTHRTAPRTQAGVARFDTAGLLDEAFIAGGVRWFPAEEAEVWTAVDVAPSGKIALAGEAGPGDLVVAALNGGPAPQA